MLLNPLLCRKSSPMTCYKGGGVNRLVDWRIWPKIVTDSRILLKNWMDLQILQKRRIMDWLWIWPQIADLGCFNVRIVDLKLARIVVFWWCSEGVGHFVPFVNKGAALEANHMGPKWCIQPLVIWHLFHDWYWASAELTIIFPKNFRNIVYLIKSIIKVKACYTVINFR